tara:strand:+ start:6122 stop:6889 length:768 start_codon:yes stop_codon:yes gene_type:complete
MLRPRLIPCLLINKDGLCKTEGFTKLKYVGDPLNAVRIFNEKEVDELMILDIDASKTSNAPNYNLISKLAQECRMPLCYGGGVNTVDHFSDIINLGVEKVAISSAAIQDPLLVSRAAAQVGSQSVVVVIDVKRSGLFNKPEVVCINATKKTGLNPVAWAKDLQKLGAGDIVLNSVDLDGKMTGYDFNLIDSVRSEVSVPLTVLGGAGSLEDIRLLFKRYGIIGASAGSLFVFKGKYKAVLINYPDRQEKKILFSS